MMSILFAWCMTVANSYLGICRVEGKSAVGQGLCFGVLLIATMGWSLNFTEYTRIGLSRFSFTPLGDVTKAFEAATNIDDEATSCIGGDSHGKGGSLRFRQQVMAVSHFHSLLEIYDLKYRQQIQILLTSDPAPPDASLHVKRMTFTIH
jgi:hypothetical protein